MNKVILITGASSGIGKAGALKLIQEGYTVYAGARRMDRMQDLKDAGGFPVRLDVTSSEDIKSVVDNIIAKEGRIDVLWNNAGFGCYGAIDDVPLDDARRVFEVNLFSMAALIQMVVPHMRKVKSGTIINTSSMGGKVYVPLGGWYHGSKHAIEGFSDCLRLELKQFNIKVVILEPGAIGTEFNTVVEEGLKKYSDKSAYTGLYKKIVGNIRRGTTEGGASHPSVIADTVSKILKTKKPKTRYAAGKMAKPSIWLRTYLGDRIFDKVISSQMK
ncbi:MULTISPECIES: oxidoreductase [Niastella]|uniref:SDR family NAD(P)-dependent oxidoreductase n=1 Tax=Niastella soli TaxID=2821487 RepID=A0ABS3YVN1_9BACT|nr:oxidoreductase [Niastella soli]MBO9201989.1 SDR family NAD(P)-dependent oxidoreductase [Niastella soli]